MCEICSAVTVTQATPPNDRIQPIEAAAAGIAIGANWYQDIHDDNDDDFIKEWILEDDCVGMLKS